MITISIPIFNIRPFTSLQPTVCHHARLSSARTASSCCCCAGAWRAAGCAEQSIIFRLAGRLERAARQAGPTQAIQTAHCLISCYGASKPTRLTCWIRPHSASSFALDPCELRPFSHRCTKKAVLSRGSRTMPL